MVVADLDAILTQPINFRFAGKVHSIRPIKVAENYAVANAISELWALKDMKEITASQLIDRYFALVSSVCPTIKRKDIEGMTQAQVTGLYQLIVDAVTGKAQAKSQSDDEEKKKRLQSL